MTLATIINYCTNDYRFLGKCLEEVHHFSDQVLIPVCDHFFDGTPENRKLLNHTYANFPNCQFIEFAYSPSKLYSPFLSYTLADEEWAHLWHSTSRYLGFLYLKPEIEHVLFLDSDEIPDGRRVAKWLQTNTYKQYNALYLFAYLYVLKSNLRAKKLQNLILFSRTSTLQTRYLLHPGERRSTYLFSPEPKKENVRGADHLPLFHHYSWVRTQEECDQKAATWAHRKEGGWLELIRQTFSGEKKFFGSTHEYEEIAEIYFDPLSVSIPTNFLHKTSFPNVKKVTHEDIFQKEIEILLQ